MYKLGKLPARPGAVKLKFTDYTTLPSAPSTEKAVNLNWGMLGNSDVGDCVFAGAGHETMAWNNEAGSSVVFDDKSVLSDYSAVTGFDPKQTQPDGSNPTDHGTDVQVAASYRQKTGVLDSSGKRHKVGAYVSVSLKNVAELKQAVYLFGAVGVGFQFPDYAMDEFNAGQTWHVKSGGTIAGGHYVPCIGYSSRYLYVVTWGKLQRMTWGFYKKYADEVIAYLSPEMLKNSVSLEGFNLSQLQTDLAQIK